MDKQKISILQFTDNHLIADKYGSFLGINPYNSLQAVIAMIMRDLNDITPQLIMHTGDISQDQSDMAYTHFIELTKYIPYPIAWTYGNHDLTACTKLLSPCTNILNEKAFIIDNWHIILIDSHQDKRIYGKVSAETLAYLQKQLEKHPNKHTMIAMHHPAFMTGSKWLDTSSLENQKEFFNIVDKHPQIKLIICGHTHQENTTQRNHITYLSTPSTSFQFARHNTEFKLDNIMPGYRWLQLYEDGCFDTWVSRIDFNKNFIPDQSTKGY